MNVRKKGRPPGCKQETAMGASSTSTAAETRKATTTILQSR
jgi:hypothetical protein